MLLNILAIDAKNNERSYKLYDKLKLNIEEFYELCIKYENKIRKLKLLNEWEDYVISDENETLLMKNVADGDKWKNYNILYCPKGVTKLSWSIWECFNNNILIIGFAKLKEFRPRKLYGVHYNNVIVACSIQDRFDMKRKFCELPAKSFTMYGRVYDEKHQLPDKLKISDMAEAFLSCNELEKLVLLDMDFSEVRNLNDTFSDCTALRELYIENIDTLRPMSLEATFCHTYFDEIDLSLINTEWCSNFTRMFSQCRRIRRIRGIEVLKCADKAKFDEMFDGCWSLRMIDLSSWDWRNKSKNKMFNGCANLVFTGILSLDLRLAIKRMCKIKNAED